MFEEVSVSVLVEESDQPRYKRRESWLVCLYLVGVVEGVIHEAGDKRSLADYLKINVEKER